MPRGSGNSWTLLLLVVATTVLPQIAGASGLGDNTLEFPSLRDLWRVLTLQDYNTRVVIIGVVLLGAACGTVGTFLLLRKRALLSDAVSHATLPGICLAFFVMTHAGGTGKSLPGLLLGAAISGALGMLTVMGIRRWSRIKDDAALGIVLSVFYGFGIVLLSIISHTEMGNAAGLQSFIYGKTASMLFSDAIIIAAVAALAGITCMVCLKELALLTFDQDFASTQGWPTGLLDLMLMTLVVVVTVAGLQAVGLILVVALLIIPPAAARFWTHDLRKLLKISALLGALSGWLGASLSALMSHLPAGAIIILSGSTFFFISLLFGRARGIVWKLVQQTSLARRVERQHLLRAVYELLEDRGGVETPEVVGFDFDEIRRKRSWRPSALWRVIRLSMKDGLLRQDGEERFLLTPNGLVEALQTVRNHRLWELYLISHADIAPSHVDRDADMIEHVLSAEMIQKLDAMIQEGGHGIVPPANPHGRGAEVRA